MASKLKITRSWFLDFLRWNVRFQGKQNFQNLRYRISRRGMHKQGSGLILGKYRKVLIIRINHSYAGLFAYFIYALNQLRYCEKHRLLPVVFFGEDSADGPNAYFDKRHGDNVWEYYFEPVGEMSHAELRAHIGDPDHTITEDDVMELGNTHLHYLHMHCPDSIFGYPYGFYKTMTEYDADWFLKQRTKARDLVKKYIQVKPHVLAIVDAFENESMQGCRMLGVHMRGTDKGAAIASDETNRKVGPAAYYEEIDQYIAKHDDCRIFVATDQEQYLEAMTERYPERVLSCDAQRSNDDLNTFQKAEGDAYKKGEEALIDCLLLSRCDFLLKCTSHLSESSMYFNPKLECIDMNYVN